MNARDHIATKNLRARLDAIVPSTELEQKLRYIISTPFLVKIVHAHRPRNAGIWNCPHSNQCPSAIPIDEST